MSKSKLSPEDRTPPELIAFLLGQLSTHPGVQEMIHRDPGTADFYVPMNYDLEGWSRNIEKFTEEHCLNSTDGRSVYEVFWQDHGRTTFWKLGKPYWKG